MSSAAKMLQLGQPTVSRRVAELEHRLGYPVFERSVSGAALTAHGEALVGPARNMARWAAELERSADRTSSLPRGTVRITAPPGIAFDFLAPFAGALRQDLPEVRLEVVSSVRYLDLTRKEADLALRMRQPSARDLVTLHTFELENAAFASQAYAATLPAGYGVRDVDWVAWPSPLEACPPNPQLEALIPGFRPTFASDDFLVQIRAMMAGAGAMVLGAARHRFTLLGTLRRLDLELGRFAQSAVHLVASKSALEIARVRAVADLVIEQFDGPPRSSRADATAPP